MNAKHTPGPWIWSAGLSIWRESDSQIVSSIACDSVSNPTEEEVSNARLISAAPDLYLFVASKAESGDNEALELLERIHGNAKRD